MWCWFGLPMGVWFNIYIYICFKGFLENHLINDSLKKTLRKHFHINTSIETLPNALLVIE